MPPKSGKTMKKADSAKKVPEPEVLFAFCFLCASAYPVLLLTSTFVMLIAQVSSEGEDAPAPTKAIKKKVVKGSGRGRPGKDGKKKSKRKESYGIYIYKVNFV